MFVLLYPVCDSVNVTSSFFFCVWMSFTCNNSFMYLLHVIILDTRARETTPTASWIYPQKRRLKQKYLAVARLLLPTSNWLVSSFHRLFTPVKNPACMSTHAAVKSACRYPVSAPNLFCTQSCHC